MAWRVKAARMGLSINITATAPAALGISEIETLLRRWHALAGKFAAEGRLAKVHGMSNKPGDLGRFASHYVSVPHPDYPDASTGIAVPPIEGGMFVASVGEGCEPLMLGLCRYPKFVNAPGGGAGGRARLIPSGAGEGWRFWTSCKTQYASTHGWEHFRRCHVAIIELAAALESFGAGATVRINDEGGWWPGRDDDALRRTLLRYNRLMAGLAGAIKDSLDEDEDAPAGGSEDGIGARKHAPLQAAIFDHPDFERLEAENQAGGDDAKIRETIRKIKSELGQ